MIIQIISGQHVDVASTKAIQIGADVDVVKAAGVRPPELFVHGHTHCSFDYRVGQTRVLCNPHGYGDENPDFNPSLIVEVGT
jgi:hypothetical protein